MSTDLTPVEQAILDHFHTPDRIHSSWWINPTEMAAAVYPLIEREVRDKVAKEIGALRQRERDEWMRLAPQRRTERAWHLEGLLAAEMIARGAS